MLQIVKKTFYYFYLEYTTTAKMYSINYVAYIYDMNKKTLIY